MSEARSRTSDALDAPPDSAADFDDLGSEAGFLVAVAAVSDVAPPSLEPERIGVRLGRFEILSELGRGGMGVVYEAEDTQLHRRVALKVLPASFATDPERRARFLREARSASAVTHSNIATVYDVNEAEGSLFIAMERVEGVSLRKLLAGGPPPLAEALRIAREIARGLGKAHDAGIVHRDLKPDNVIVGREGTVKILDFGLAKPFGTRERAMDGTPNDLDTRDGRILGTPSYMSPEQAKGWPVDARSDIFSFGALLYEMLSARRAFSAAGTVELLIAIDRDPPPPLLEGPRKVVAVVERCLAKRPEDRFDDVRAVIEALDAAEGASELRRRRWLLAAAAAAIALAAVAGFGLRRGRPEMKAPLGHVAPMVSLEVKRAVAGARVARKATAVIAPTVSASWPATRAHRAPPYRVPATPRRALPVRTTLDDPLADQK